MRASQRSFCGGRRSSGPARPSSRGNPCSWVRRGFVGEGSAPAAEYHASDFAWEEVEQAGLAAVAEQRRQRAAAAQKGAPQAEAGQPRRSAAQEGSAWERFHSTHSRARFFKEKRYLLLEFPVLGAAHPPQHIAEIGCGCGAAVLPVLKANPTACVTACDVSPTALELLRGAAANAGINAGHLSTLVLDASVPPGGPSSDGCSVGCPSPLAGLGADSLLLVFTLSALAPADMPAALAHAREGLRPGGLLLVRDYGLYDMAMLRFPGSQMLGDALYRRSDGTLAYFFSTAALRSLAEAAGFETVECQYACVAVRNRKRGSSMRRVFVHGVFRRPAAAPAGLP